MWLAFLACSEPSVVEVVPGTEPPPVTVPTGGTTVVTDPTTPEPARRNFTLALWMAADNDLEPSVEHDLNELEGGARDDLNIVVQVDRAPGYLPGWEGTKRFEIVADTSADVVSTEVADLGEVNSGDGAALADFLLWANETYPADHFAVLMWNHGGGFWIASDDTSLDEIRIDDGELSDALAALAEARGEKIDLITFDACNMAQWENGYALREQVQFLAASQAWVGWEGYGYTPALQSLPEGADGLDLATALAESAMDNGEHTHSIIDLGQMDGLAAAVDGLGAAYLASPGGAGRFRTVLADAAGLDAVYDDFWMDLGSMAEQAELDEDPEVAAAAAGVRQALGLAVADVYNAESVSFASGLTIYADLTETWIERYQGGPWADVTQWDELLVQAAAL